MEQRHHPPTCPTCGTELTRLWEVSDYGYIFNDQSGYYDENLSDSEMSVKCNECRTEVTELFADGVLNYATPKAEAEQPIQPNL